MTCNCITGNEKRKRGCGQDFCSSPLWVIISWTISKDIDITTQRSRRPLQHPTVSHRFPGDPTSPGNAHCSHEMKRPIGQFWISCTVPSATSLDLHWIWNGPSAIFPQIVYLILSQDKFSKKKSKLCLVSCSALSQDMPRYCQIDRPFTVHLWRIPIPEIVKGCKNLHWRVKIG